MSLAQGNNTPTRPRIEPESPDPESDAQYFMTLALMAVRKEVNNFESSVVVQELEFAMNLALYWILLTHKN